MFSVDTPASAGLTSKVVNERRWRLWMDVDKRAALSTFYREEFLRHIEHLQATGILDESNLEVVERAQRALLCLDRLCGHSHFHQVAESLLQSFDALSGLSTADPRQRH
jgi:hypothetical protein